MVSEDTVKALFIFARINAIRMIAMQLVLYFNRLEMYRFEFKLKFAYIVPGSTSATMAELILKN